VRLSYFFCRLENLGIGDVPECNDAAVDKEGVVSVVLEANQRTDAIPETENGNDLEYKQIILVEEGSEHTLDQPGSHITTKCFRQGLEIEHLYLLCRASIRLVLC